MLINSVYPNINKIKILPYSNMFKRHSDSQAKLCPTNSNALQLQLNFEGLANQYAVAEPIVDTGAVILRKYLGKFVHFYDIPGVSILYNSTLPKCQKPLVLLNEATEFNRALKLLSRKVDKINNLYTIPYTSNLSREKFILYRSAIGEGKIPDKSIKGIIGQGRFSTAFLEPNYTVSKLSRIPNFPAKKHFIEGVDLPIYDRKIVTIGNTIIHYVHNPLVELASTKFDPSNPKDLEEFGKYWDILNDNLKKYNNIYGTNYSFGVDFKRSDPESMRQMGFIGDTPYLIDYQCIDGRPLAA